MAEQPKDDAASRKQDPAEGSREIIERELKRQEETAKQKPQNRPS